MILTISRASAWAMVRRASRRSWLMAVTISSEQMPTLMQKIRLAFKGWNRRRDEKQKEFLAQNVGWGKQPEAPSPSRPPLAATRSSQAEIDVDGLIVAFLDDSGVISYYLDTESGEVVDVRDGSTYAAPRYRRVPPRSEAVD